MDFCDGDAIEVLEWWCCGHVMHTACFVVLQLQPSVGGAGAQPEAFHPGLHPGRWRH